MSWQSNPEGEALLSLLAEACEPDQGARLFASNCVEDDDPLVQDALAASTQESFGDDGAV